MTLSAIDEIMQQEGWKGKDFQRWLKTIGVSQKDAAKLLGMGVRQVRSYMKDDEAVIPRRTQLACSYVMVRYAVHMKKATEGSIPS
jgi:predicted transcriptional regulator